MLATPFEVEQIRALQATEDLLFGEAALRLGILDERDLDRVLASREHSHRHLGEALVTLGYLTREQVEAAAAKFLADEARIEAELVNIPDGLPYRDLAAQLFQLAHKLLLRVCDLGSKTERLRIVTGVLPLSDRNVRMPLSGDVDSAVILSVPDAIAVHLAARFSGELSPSDADIDNVVRELGSLLCRNLESVAAEQGRRLQCGEPERVPARVSLAPGERVALVPFLTHRGQVLVSLALPPEVQP